MNDTASQIYGNLLAAQPLDLWLGTCTPCQRGVRARDGHGKTCTITCPGCGGPVAAERIYGTITVELCHGKCMGAVGPSCSCACGGRNHGGAWEETGEAFASAVEAYQARAAKVAAEARKRQDRKRAQFDRWAAPYRDLVDAILAAEYGGNDFLADLASQLRDLQPLTERQLAAAERSIKRDAEYTARQAEITARQAEFAATAKPVPTGKVTFTGEVLHCKWVSTYFGGRESGSCKAMILTDAGYKVHGTMPGALVDQARNELLDARGTWNGAQSMTGRRVELTATVTAKDCEPGFGFFSRPKGRLLPAETTQDTRS